MFIIPCCPLKRRREQNERGRLMRRSAYLSADGRHIRIGISSEKTTIRRSSARIARREQIYYPAGRASQDARSRFPQQSAVPLGRGL